MNHFLREYTLSPDAKLYLGEQRTHYSMNMKDSESSARVSGVSSKEDDDLLLRSNRKVKRKTDGDEAGAEMDVDKEKNIEGVKAFYCKKLLDTVVPFSAFDGRC